MSSLFRPVGLFVLVLLGTLVAGCAGRTQVRLPDDELIRIRAAIEKTLNAPPPGGYAAIPKGVRLLSIGRLEGNAIALDFSRELTAAGSRQVLEDSVHQILTAASGVRTASAAPPAPAGKPRVEDYRVSVEGVPLESIR